MQHFPQGNMGIIRAHLFLLNQNLEIMSQTRQQNEKSIEALSLGAGPLVKRILKQLKSINITDLRHLAIFLLLELCFCIMYYAIYLHWCSIYHPEFMDLDVIRRQEFASLFGFMANYSSVCNTECRSYSNKLQLY